MYKFGHMSDMDELRAQILRLESDLEKRDREIKELKEKRREALDLVDQMSEHVQDGRDLIESWIEVCDMKEDESGVWLFDVNHADLIERYNKLHGEHQKLVSDWNKFVGQWNREVDPRERGRPIAASAVQIEEVRKLHKGEASLRAIAENTGLGLRTVRTIVEKDAGTDRTTKRTNLLRKREFDRRRAADWRAKKKQFDALPNRITDHQKRGEELRRAAKDIVE